MNHVAVDVQTLGKGGTIISLGYCIFDMVDGIQESGEWSLSLPDEIIITPDSLRLWLNQKNEYISQDLINKVFAEKTKLRTALVELKMRVVEYDCETLWTSSTEQDRIFRKACKDLDLYFNRDIIKPEQSRCLSTMRDMAKSMDFREKNRDMQKFPKRCSEAEARWIAVSLITMDRHIKNTHKKFYGNRLSDVE